MTVDRSGNWPKKDGGAGRGWRELLAGRQGGNFIVGGETNFLADGHFFAPIVGGEAICSFLKEY